MDKYEIGIRLGGYPKKYLKALTCEISKKFQIKKNKKIVPHLNFLRPFTTNNETELIENFGKTLSKYNQLITYTLEGFGTFENKEKVFYGKIKSNPQIENMINDLEKSLEENINFINPKIKLPEEKQKINLHCSIISKGVNKYFSEIDYFLNKQKFSKNITHPLLRVYLLRNKFILREFDFYLNENLDEWDSMNSFIFDRTEKAFKEKTGFEITKDGLLLPVPESFQ